MSALLGAAMLLFSNPALINMAYFDAMFPVDIKYTNALPSLNVCIFLQHNKCSEGYKGSKE